MSLENNKKKIRFITNPFSGTKSKANLQALIDEHLDSSKFDAEISFTQYPRHANELTIEAKDMEYYAVIAVGGDGTINEVASELVHSKTALGIVPFGSGNGFSYHLGIRRDVVKAIQTINHCHTQTIDTGLANNRFFINVAGLGLDATVAYKTKLNTKRGFIPYFLNTLKESFGFRFMPLQIRTKDKTWETEYAMAVVANGSIYGYDFAVAPAAILNDGLFDVILVKKTYIFKYFFLVVRMLTKTFHKSPLVEYFKTDHLEITNRDSGYFHVDGEGLVADDTIQFTIQPSSLIILTKPQ